jgi:hypothetical protein
MAKRGETRPYRMHFEWDNGVKSTQTFHSEEARQRVIDQIRETAERIDREVTITTSERPL